MLGLTAYDERSEDLSAEAFARREAQVVEWSRRFRALNDGLAPRIYCDRAIGQAKAAARYARELVPAEIKDAATREMVAAAGGNAAKAYEDFAAFLEANQTRCAGNYAIGEPLYTALLREKEL